MQELQNSKDFEKPILVINKKKNIAAVQFLNFIHSQQKSKLKIKPIKINRCKNWGYYWI